MSASDFKVVRLLHGPSFGDGLIMVMVCYLDDSDAEHSPVGTLAGYVATADNWELLEDHLHEVCKRYGVDVLHAKEFHDTKACFKGWSRVKKNSFVDELYAKSNHMVFGISYSASKDWPDIRGQIKGNERTSLFGMIFASILLRMTHQTPLSPHMRNHGLSFMVESGHKNNSEIQQYFHRAKSFPQFQGVLRSISFVDKHSSRAIQLADFLAFHARRRAALASAKRLGVTLPHDGMIKRIYSKGPHLEAITPAGMSARLATFDEFNARSDVW